MKGRIRFGVICVVVGFLVGYMTSSQPTLTAQGGDGGVKRTGLGPGPAASRFVDGNAFVIMRDEVVKKFPAADKTGKVAEGGPSTNLGWDPVYSLVVMRRPYFDPPQKNSGGELARWAGSEMHEQKAQLYMIMGGTGTMTLGGKPTKIRGGEVNNGQWGGGDLTPAMGATAHKVKAGDMVVIPTYAWHQIQADAGQTVTYIKVDIAEPRLMP